MKKLSIYLLVAIISLTSCSKELFAPSYGEWGRSNRNIQVELDGNGNCTKVYFSVQDEGLLGATFTDDDGVWEITVEVGDFDADRKTVTGTFTHHANLPDLVGERVKVTRCF